MRQNYQEKIQIQTAIKSVINWLDAVYKWSLLFLNARTLQLNNLNVAPVTEAGYVMQRTSLTLESRLYANLMSITSCIYAAVSGAACLISLLEGGGIKIDGRVWVGIFYPSICQRSDGAG